MSSHAEAVQQDKDALVEKVLAHLEGDASWERVRFLAHKYRTLLAATCPKCFGAGTLLEGWNDKHDEERSPCPAKCDNGRKREEAR